MKFTCRLPDIPNIFHNYTTTTGGWVVEITCTYTSTRHQVTLLTTQYATCYRPSAVQVFSVSVSQSIDEPAAYPMISDSTWVVNILATFCRYVCEGDGALFPIIAIYYYYYCWINITAIIIDNETL